MVRERILIVDDEPDIREMLCIALEDVGYECVVAPSADEAIRLAESQRFDLALLDVMMPRLSGVEVFRRISRSRPSMAAIFVTAVPDHILASDVLRAGASDYLVKPVALEVVQQAVQKALAKRSVEAVGDETEGAVPTNPSLP